MLYQLWKGEKMKEEFEKYGIPLSAIQEKQLSIYYELLYQWNQRINLTAITEYDKVVRKHFIDSALLVKSPIYNSNEESNRVLDLGTGAGFPGMVLAILCPEDDFVLVDSLNKRIDFLNIVIKELGLKNVQAIHGRAEDYGQKNDFRNCFDFVVSRAVAELPLLLEYCVPFVKVNGYFVSYKGPKYEEEIIHASNALHELNTVVETVEEYDVSRETSVPDSNKLGEEIEKRYLVFLKNTALTNSKYPRRAGKPKKKPL